MPPKQNKKSLKSQLEEAERRGRALGRKEGRKQGMDAVLAALSAADAEQLSDHSHFAEFLDDDCEYFQARLDAAMLNAAERNQIDLVLSLLKSEAQIDACNKDDHSALLVAVQAGHAELVKALLKAGAGPNYSGVNIYLTPLECAMEEGHLEVVKALLAAGAAGGNAHQSGKPGFLVSYDNEDDQVELTRAFIEAGAYIGPDEDSYTPLLYAAMNGKTESAALLIKAGCDVHDENDEGETALMLAAGGDGDGTCDTISLLLKSGAEINHNDNDGRTALICAAMAGRSEAVRLLISAGANVFHEAQNVPEKSREGVSKAGNAFDAATDDAVKEIIKIFTPE